MKIQSHHAFALLALLVITMSLTGNGQVPESLKKIEDQYVAAFQLHVEEGHQSKVAELNAKYLVALERAFQAASKGDRLEEALALKEEIKRVQEKQPLPEKDDGARQVMVKLRTTYRDQFTKLMADRAKSAAPIVKKFDESAAALQSDLTKSGRVEEAAVVKAYRESGVAAKLLGEKEVTSSSSSPGKPIIENSSWRTPTGTLFVFEPDGKGTRSFAGADQTTFTWRQRSGGVVEVNGEGSKGGKSVTWFFRFVNQQETYYGNSKDNITTALQRQP